MNGSVHLMETNCIAQLSPAVSNRSPVFASYTKKIVHALVLLYNVLHEAYIGEPVAF